MVVIGTYPICNNGGILVHDFDNYEDKILASMNGMDRKWCALVEDGDGNPGFYYGEMYVRLEEVMRV